MMQYVSARLYLLSMCFIFLYASYIIFKHSTPETKIFDLILITFFVGIASIVVAIYCLSQTNLLMQISLLMLIIWLVPICFLYTKSRKASQGCECNAVLYAVMWLIVVVLVYSCIFLVFGAMDYKYLADELKIKVSEINGNANVQSVFLYFCMIGYYAIMTFVQMPVQDKIFLVASEHGWVFSFQILIITIVTIVTVLCVPSKIKEIYKDIKCPDLSRRDE